MQNSGPGARRGLRHGRYLVFIALFASISLLLRSVMNLDYALAAGFDIAAAVFILSAAGHWQAGAPEMIRSEALRDDGRRATLILVTFVIIFLVLVTVASLVERKTHLSLPGIAFVVATLVIAWFFANLVYAFHYARMYYDRGPEGDDHRGLAFPGGDDPSFADFVNFSFVLGMTSQAADIGITRSAMRRATTVHGVIAFFFNLGVLALTINVIATAL